MKRGNTALKRGVGLASAFALAIAGAVIAAPAANAAPGTGPAATDAIRVAPVANAANVDATGAAADYTFGRGYGSAATDAATGTAKVLKAGSNGQQIGGLQIALPHDFSANPVVVTLTGADFTGVPSVTLDPVERTATNFTGLAGFAGDNASVAGAISGHDLASGTLGASTLTLSNELTINLAKAATTGADAAGVYLLSINNVAVNVASATPGGTAVTAALKINSVASGVTTVGYVAKTSISIASGAVEADGGAVTLPDVTVSEAQVGAIVNGTPVTINLTSDATGAKFVTSSDTKITVAGSSATVAFTTAPATGATSFAFEPTADDTTKIETYTITGLKLQTVPANADVTLTVSGSGITAVNNPGAVTTSGSTSEFAFTPSLVGVSATVETTVPEPRIAGSDRYATAAAILDEGAGSAFTLGHAGPGAVVLANGETAKQGVDALSANYLAGAKHVPILLTTANSLPVATQTALIKLFKDTTAYTGDITVYVLGKTDSVSQAVRDQAKALIKSVVSFSSTDKGVVIKEVAGDNRYSTSAAVATEAGAAALQVHSLDTAKGWLRTAFLTSGTSNADALAAGSVAAKAGIPVLLTNGKTLDAKVEAAIKDLGIQQIIVLGGTDRVSDALVDSLTALGVTNTKRIAGANRYATAADIYSWAWAPTNPTESGVTSRGLNWGGSDVYTAYIANGTDGFADALAVGPLAGHGSNPILTTAVDSLSDGAVKFLKDNKADFKTNGIQALGQQDRISSAVITAAQGALK